MARLQILELPEGTGDDRPPFVLVVDECQPQRVVLGHDSTWQDHWQMLADKIGARGVIVTPDTIDIPANDTTAYLDAAATPEASLKLDDHDVRSAIAADMNKAREQAGLGTLGQQLADERTDIARGMDRLTNHKAALADALGMDRTRDWDDIINAATGLRQEHAAQAEEVKRLRAGEEPGWDVLVVPTPGQWIGRWNQASAGKRLSMAAQILDGMKRSSACFAADHEGQIARLRAESSRPTHPDGTPYRYHEIKAEGWGHCDGCRTWGQWTAEEPHDCINAQAMSATPDA